MPKRPELTPDVLGGDVPELDDAFFARARRGSDALSPEFLAKVRRLPGRPKLDQPKTAVSLRLDADVVLHLRAKGRGWQTLVNDRLAELINTGKL
jgi:uncharacterized protein (DUF4415 family)